MARELPVFVDPACRGAEDVLFFGRSTLIAQSICARCPSVDKTKCYEYALNVLVDGVWGGTTRTQRDTVRKELGLTAELPYEPERVWRSTDEVA